MISREDCVEQSVFDYAKDAIRGRGYPESQVELLESFPYRMSDAQFTRTLVAAGFNFDDDGKPAELGSDLKVRQYHVQFFVFGMTATYGRNLANVLKFAMERDGQIPLKNVAVDGDPVIDYLEVLGVSAERQIVPDPEPWQEFVWTTTLRVEDVYSAGLA